MVKWWEEVKINSKCASHIQWSWILLKRGTLNSPQTLLGHEGTKLTQLILWVYTKLQYWFATLYWTVSNISCRWFQGRSVTSVQRLCKILTYSLRFLQDIGSVALRVWYVILSYW